MEERTASTTASDLMKAADATMYWAKQDGSARLALFDRARSTREITRYGLSSAMRAALDRGEFFVEYQPIVALTDKTVLGVEALVRWQHPTLHMLGPDKFIDLAEENGLIEPLGAFVLEQACRDCRTWQDTFAGHAPYVSVNLAARQMSDPHLVAKVRQITAAAGIAPSALQLELTERSLVTGNGRPVSCLRDLSELGVRLAIDDFGTGHSKLAYLGRLRSTSSNSPARSSAISTPPSHRPLGRRADRRLGHRAGPPDRTHRDRGMCRDPAQAAQADSTGLRHRQGWYFAKSMRAHDLTEYLTDHRTRRRERSTAHAAASGTELAVRDSGSTPSPRATP